MGLILEMKGLAGSFHSWVNLKRVKPWATSLQQLVKKSQILSWRTAPSSCRLKIHRENVYTYPFVVGNIQSAKNDFLTWHHNLNRACFFKRQSSVLPIITGIFHYPFQLLRVSSYFSSLSYFKLHLHDRFRFQPMPGDKTSRNQVTCFPTWYLVIIGSIETLIKTFTLSS